MSPKDEEKAVKISVESKDPKEKESTVSRKKQDTKDNEPVMSEEDQELKERIETCVFTLINKESEDSVTVPLRLKALDVIVTELRSATSSMTSVPKPLKFLRPHFAELKNLHATLESDSSVLNDSDYILLRARLADVLSVLAMTMGDDGK
jgi:26S proteasome regulatory complex component